MKNNKLKKDVYTNFALITQFGISMLVPVLLSVAIGVYIDKRFNTYLTLPLLIIGILAGVRNTWLLAKKANHVSEGERKSIEESRLVDEAVKTWKEKDDNSIK